MKRIEKVTLALVLAVALLAAPALALAQSTGAATDLFGRLNGNGNAPAISGSCGTGPAVVGTDAAFKLTTGSGSPTSCVATFTKAYTNAPVCIGKNQTAIARDPLVTTTTTAATIAATFTAGDVVTVVCIGY